MDTFQIIILVAIVVIFAAMVVLLFVGGRKSSGDNKKKVENKIEAPVAPIAPVESAPVEAAPVAPVVDTVVANDNAAESAFMEPAAPIEAPTEEVSAPVEAAPVEPMAPVEVAAVEPAAPVADGEITLEVGKSYTIGQEIKGGIYNLATVDGSESADINIYGLDVSYKNGDQLILSDGDVLIAKTAIKIKK